MTSRSRALAAALAGADLAGLLLLAPMAAHFGHDLRAPRSWASHSESIDAACIELCGAALWVVCAWFAVGGLAILTSRLPGEVGRAAARLSQALLPVAVARAGAAVVGASVLLTPCAAHGQARSIPTTGSASAAAGPLPALPPPVWPRDTTLAPSLIELPAPTLPGQDAPATPQDGGAPSPGSPPPAPRAAGRWPAPTAAPRRPAAPPPPSAAQRTIAPRPATKAPTTSSEAAVTVQPGDSLWAITARRLGPDATPPRVAAGWPRWYQVNRSIIGLDPARLRPGQRLRPPGPDQETTS